MFLKTLRSTALLRTRTSTSGRPKPTPSSTVERPRRLARTGVAGLLVDGRHAKLAAGELEPVHCLEGRLSRLELEVPVAERQRSGQRPAMYDERDEEEKEREGETHWTKQKPLLLPVIESRCRSTNSISPNGAKTCLTSSAVRSKWSEPT